MFTRLLSLLEAKRDLPVSAEVESSFEPFFFRRSAIGIMLRRALLNPIFEYIIDFIVTLNFVLLLVEANEVAQSNFGTAAPTNATSNSTHNATNASAATATATATAIATAANLVGGRLAETVALIEETDADPLERPGEGTDCAAKASALHAAGARRRPP